MAAYDIRPDIDAAKAWMHTSVSNREIRHLPTVLHATETVQALATGQHAGASGLLAVTDERLLFLHAGLRSHRLTSFPHPDITSVEWYAGATEGVLVLHAPTTRTEIKSIHNADGQTITTALHHWTPAH